MTLSPPDGPPQALKFFIPTRLVNGKVVHGEDPSPPPQFAPPSERWPTTVPENLALPNTWLPRDHAARMIAKANGVDDLNAVETGTCYLIAMMAAGLVDARDGEVRLLSEDDRAGTPRPGSPEAALAEARLASLAADLKTLGMRAVPVDPA